MVAYSKTMTYYSMAKNSRVVKIFKHAKIIKFLEQIDDVSLIQSRPQRKALGKVKKNIKYRSGRKNNSPTYF